jgi:hypothetical protein
LLLTLQFAFEAINWFKKNKSPSLPNLFVTYKHKIKPNHQRNRAPISYYINRKGMMLIYLEDTMCNFLFHHHEKHPWQFHKFLHIMFVHVLYGFHARNIDVFPPIINVAPKPSINIYGFHVASKINNAFLFWMNWQKSSSSKISTLAFITSFCFSLVSIMFWILNGSHYKLICMNFKIIARRICIIIVDWSYNGRKHA